MKKLSILIPQHEFLNRYKGGAIARWIDDVYRHTQSRYKFYILGRTLNNQDDFKSHGSSYNIVSKYNGLMKILTNVPVLRHIMKPFISSIYLKIYKKNILDSEMLEVHNAFEYVSKIKKFNFSGKIILHMHNNYLEKQSQKTIDTLNSQIDLLFFPSQALKNDFLSIHPSFTKPIKVSHCGYDPKKFFPKQELVNKPNPIIGYIGRFDSNKNILNLLDIYIALLDKIPNLEFYLIGSGKSGGIGNKYQKRVMKKVATINQQNGKITYLGYIHNDELADYYNLFDIFLSLPVETEAGATTFVEALACKTICIGSKIGGIPEVIGNNELVVNNPRDHTEVVDKIVGVLSDKALQESLKEKTFEHISANFQWKTIREKKIKDFDLLVEEF
ncbi:glycosyltransferase family 4 protein [Sulfurovum mangrovi]|uniref:glycosyltransferase family 4 protein n=1 Tax=Sulfurovum mangrovi TaxID=2893889 RepID=UPI001E65044C|nr:glycosyltransferase family 4 protein [Sulfurovum mangrovi]UFH58845.1 glycosyltransferase family 4 protein [Sulfurovum mangrovi]